VENHAETDHCGDNSSTVRVLSFAEEVVSGERN
jgi:hypothetical protein